MKTQNFITALLKEKPLPKPNARSSGWLRTGAWRARALLVADEEGGSFGTLAFCFLLPQWLNFNFLYWFSLLFCFFFSFLEYFSRVLYVFCMSNSCVFLHFFWKQLSIVFYDRVRCGFDSVFVLLSRWFLFFGPLGIIWIMFLGFLSNWTVASKLGR